MNVLVYTGPEVIQTSLSNVLSSLRSLLLPNYVVQPIEHIALVKQPWHTSCALLVFPRLCQSFTAPACTQIQDYVDRGGAFLALGTGARSEIRAGVTAGIADAMASLSLGKLRFYDKFNNVDIIPTIGSSGDGEKLTSLKSADGDIIHALYESHPQGDYTGFKNNQSIKILGHYLPEETIAGIGCDIGAGRIALWSPALEQPLSSSPASALLSAFQEASITDLDKERLRLLQRTILYLGLHLPVASSISEDDNEDAPIARPFPQFLVCSPRRPDVVDRIVTSLSDAFELSDDEDKPKIIKDSNDILSFHSSADPSTQTLLESSKNLLRTPSEPSTWQPKRIVIHRKGTLPSQTYTHPYFDLPLFFQHLNSARSIASAPPTGDSPTWPLGTALFFTPSITSTQTLLDKNPKYLSSLPTPTVHIASYQLLARGRGSNVWLSPTGSLSKSVHLRLPPSTGVQSSKLVFVQYLYAMAVCQGVRDDSVLGDGDGGEGWRVRIKWPNDVYALVGPKGGKENEMEKKKIGGILVNMSFGTGGADIVIGCGLNVFNDQPMTSLLQLLRRTSLRRTNLSLEHTAAAILTRFESLWAKFLDSKGSFEPFLDDYLKLWLHSDQPVLLTTTNPPTPVRITGITLDHGLLRTIPERPTSNPYFVSSSGGRGNEEYIDLQPDGNSFDLMAGLIRTKQ